MCRCRKCKQTTTVSARAGSDVRECQEIFLDFRESSILYESLPTPLKTPGICGDLVTNLKRRAGYASNCAPSSKRPSPAARSIRRSRIRVFLIFLCTTENFHLSKDHSYKESPRISRNKRRSKFRSKNSLSRQQSRLKKTPIHLQVQKQN